MSGFEIAGIVLGALPFLSEFAKTSRDRYDSAARAIISTSKAKRDLDLLLYDFYHDLNYETFVLQKTLEIVFDRLPTTFGVSSQDFMSRVLYTTGAKGSESDEWVIQDSLRRIFQSDGDLGMFLSVVKNLLGLFYRFHSNVDLPRGFKDHKEMCRVIQVYEKRKKKPYWHFNERRKFFEQEDVRRKWLKQLKKANKRLNKIVHLCKFQDSISQLPDSSPASVQLDGEVSKIQPSHSSKHHISGSVQEDSNNINAVFKENTTRQTQYLQSTQFIRSLSLRLFSAIRGFWDCRCETRHDVGFGLGICEPDRHSRRSSPPAEKLHGFDLVFWQWHDDGSKRIGWQEATVTITPTCTANSGLRMVPLKPIPKQKSICDVTELYRQKQASFRLQIENINHQHRLLPPEPRTRQLSQYSQKVSPPTISLKQIFIERSRQKYYHKPKMSVRLKLASIFACSLCQLYESPWSSSRWDKEHLSFFLTRSGKPDWEHPYLNTSFDDESFSDIEDEHRSTATSILTHRKVGILKLAILLLELYRWKPIEELRDGRDGDDESLNTDMFAAIRLYEKYNHRLPHYFDSVAGCLNMPWREDLGVEVTFDDEETRIGFYQRVIQPLERQANMLEEYDELQSTTPNCSTSMGSKVSMKSSRRKKNL